MKTGSFVECIDDKFSSEQLQQLNKIPKEGNYYTIRDIVDYPKLGRTGVRLEELSNPLVEMNGGMGEPTFNIFRFRESSNNYKAVNQFGYLGKYQFGRKTLNAIGFKDISNYEFLSNPEIQEEAMLVLLQKNKHTLRREIKKYVGETVNGIYITESGILAAAHLGGAGNVRKFFKKGHEFEDGNGTKMTSYMIRFADYNLSLK